jgi:hypothetical protein
MPNYLFSVLQTLSSPFSCFGCPANEEAVPPEAIVVGTPGMMNYSKSLDALTRDPIEDVSTHDQDLRLGEFFMEPEDETIPMNQIPEINTSQEKKDDRQLIVWPPRKHQDPFIAMMAAQWEAKMSGIEIDNSHLIIISRQRIDQLKRELFRECRLGLLEEF